MIGFFLSLFIDIECFLFCWLRGKLIVEELKITTFIAFMVTGVSKADEAKRQRDERRAQRQKEIEQKRAAKAVSGAMKLGAKKKATD